MQVQSIRFKRNKYTRKEAYEKTKEMGFKTNIKPNPQYLNWWAFRQIQPSKFNPDSFKTKKFENGDIMIIEGELL